MNVLLCIGCDTYDFLSGLSGAERDAEDVSALLASQPDGYDSGASALLLSPNLSSIQTALNAVLSSGANVDVFTFFFAGHGEVKAGSFYLCVRDSTPDRLSTTAFPMISLFSVINELHPSQVNIVIDACHAGGSSFDLNQLAKPVAIGSSDASSI